jgi:hypothetical protein
VSTKHAKAKLIATTILGGPPEGAPSVETWTRSLKRLPEAILAALIRGLTAPPPPTPAEVEAAGTGRYHSIGTSDVDCTGPGCPHCRGTGFEDGPPADYTPGLDSPSGDS